MRAISLCDKFFQADFWYFMRQGRGSYDGPSLSPSRHAHLRCAHKKKKEPREGPFPKKEKILSGIRNLRSIRRGAMMEINRIYLSTIPTFTNITKCLRDF